MLLVCVAACHTKILFAMGLGRSGKVLVGAINVKKICFVFCFLALFFLLFLFFSAPVNVVFLLLLFSAVLFVVLFRPFMCVCCYCCLVVFVFGRDKYNFLVLRFLSVLFFCVVGFFQDRYVCCYFCCVVFCILFAVLFRPVSLFRCSFRSAAVVFGIAYAMPW